MKKITFFFSALLLFCFSASLQAQITIGKNQAPQSYSVLELVAQYKSGEYGGFRLPQMTTAQRDALGVTPADMECRGLMIYNMTINCVETWNGTKWLSFCGDSSSEPIYTLSFNAAPQSSPTAIIVTSGTAIGTLPTVAPPAGNTFGGWFIGTTQITATTVWNYTTNQIAKAKWIQNYANTPCPSNSHPDSDGNVYPVYNLAGLCWTANLATTTYTNTETMDFSKPYENSATNLDIFGRLYTWYSAVGVDEGNNSMLPVDCQGICPDGWRLPTTDELNRLYALHANELKSNNAAHWTTPGTDASPFKFDSRGAGFYNSATTNFENLKSYTAYWACDAVAGDMAPIAYLTSGSDEVLISTLKKTDAASVRCVFDDFSSSMEGKVNNGSGGYLKFMNYNLGAAPAVQTMTATQQAAHTTAADTYGDLYQWGRMADGHEKRTSPIIAGPVSALDGNGQPTGTAIGKFIVAFDWRTPPNDNLWGVPKTVQDPCPAGWRVPTQAEWQTVKANNTWTWQSSPVPGYKISYNGGVTTTLFLPAAGRREPNEDWPGVLNGYGEFGVYWCNTGDSSSKSAYIYLQNDYVNFEGGTHRGTGHSIRCVAE